MLSAMMVKVKLTCHCNLLCNSWFHGTSGWLNHHWNPPLAEETYSTHSVQTHSPLSFQCFAGCSRGNICHQYTGFWFTLTPARQLTFIFTCKKKNFFF